MAKWVPVWGLLAAAGPLWLVYTGAPGWYLILAHGTVALATHAVWRSLGRPPLDATRAAWLAFAFPVLGALVACAVGARHGDPEGVPAEPPGRPGLGPHDAAPLPARERGLWELEPALRSGNLEAKLAAVRGLKQLSKPGVAALRAVLANADHQTALLASLALAELETEYEAAIRQGRERLARSATPAAKLVLAATLRKYATSGLPPEAATRLLWQEVATLAAEAGPVAYGHLAAARLALGDPRAALAAADAMLALAPHAQDPAFTRLEALYALGELTRLRQVAAECLSACDADSPLHAVASYWSNAHGQSESSAA